MGHAGLPEEVAIAKAALRRGWAAVAFSSIDRKQRCWDTRLPGREPDSSSDISAARAWHPHPDLGLL